MAVIDDVSRELVGSFLELEFALPGGEFHPKRLRFFTSADFRAFAPAPAALGFADSIDAAGVVTAGELVARQQALAENHACGPVPDDEVCPRCSFEFAIRDVVELGSILEDIEDQQALPGDDDEHLQPLSLEEKQILELCRDWDVADTIDRCRE